MSTPHRPAERFRFRPLRPCVICRPPHRLRGKIAVVEVKNPFVDFDLRDCTALSLRRFFKSSNEDKRWRCSVMTKLCEMEVQGQRSGGNSALSVKVASDTPDVGEHSSDERRATEQRRKCVWGVGSVHLDRPDAE